MPRPERGQTPAGFRQQVLQRLRNEALGSVVPVQRLQQRVAYERLLARLAGGDWVLKGGFALQLRYGLLTRPTKDVDLRTALPVHEALERLRRTVEGARLADHFGFDLGPAARELQGAPGGSLRVRVVARLAGLEFVTFHVDLSSGDALVDCARQVDAAVEAKRLRFRRGLEARSWSRAQVAVRDADAAVRAAPAAADHPDQAATDHIDALLRAAMLLDAALTWHGDDLLAAARGRADPAGAYRRVRTVVGEIYLSGLQQRNDHLLAD